MSDCHTKFNTMTSTKCSLTLFRWFFGFWIAYVGISKWLLFGPLAFQAHLSSEFASTWLPATLVSISGWIILVAEPLLGIWLLSGIAVRLAWIAGSLLMFLLTFGMTVKMDPGVSDNWFYLVLCLVGVFFAPECCSHATSKTTECCKSKE